MHRANVIQHSINEHIYVLQCAPPCAIHGVADFIVFTEQDLNLHHALVPDRVAAHQCRRPSLQLVVYRANA